ncbi:ABC transporter substrate-binding protein [Streptomyces sp. NPDC058221]|uniref:ABC transporter substrate-binding protein n=1 Tax=Streptomyces sp. NPDC058221 TaxID=3346388 RepID=UPI0036EB12F6
MKQPSVRLTTAALVVLLSASGLTACGGAQGTAVKGPWKDVVAAAEAEGAVSFYSVMPGAQNKRLVDAFGKEYPDIVVNLTRGAGELPARVESEIKSELDGADVFLYSDPSWFNDQKAAFLDVDGPSRKGWHDDAWAVKSKVVVPSSYPYSMLVWNKEMFPKGFGKWRDAVDPSVKGKIGLRTDVTTSLAGYLDFQEKELGEDYLVKSGELKPKFYPSVVTMTQAVASGEIGVTNTSTPSTVKELQAQGAPIGSAVPDPSYWIGWGAAALKKAYRPNSARVFLDFMMSEKGQAAINGDGFGGAGRDGVQGALERPEHSTMLDSSSYTPERLEEANKKFNKWFD